MCDDLNENDPHRLICLKLGLQLVERIRGGHAGGGVAVLEEVWPCWRGVAMLEEAWSCWRRCVNGQSHSQLVSLPQPACCLAP